METQAWASWAGLLGVALLYYWLAGVSVVIGVSCLFRRPWTGLSGLLVGASLFAAATGAVYLALRYPAVLHADFRALADVCKAAILKS